VRLEPASFHCLAPPLSILSPPSPAPGALGLIDLCRADFQNYPNECERTTLKEESDFRNERDVVPRSCRDSDRSESAELIFFVFWKGGALQRDAEVESF